jgi:hypothetical protein
MELAWCDFLSAVCSSGGGLYSTSSSTAVTSPGETVDGPLMAVSRSMAKRFGVWLSVGSFPKRMSPDEMEKGYNLQLTGTHSSHPVLETSSMLIGRFIFSISLF